MIITDNYAQSTFVEFLFQQMNLKTCQNTFWGIYQ